MTEALISVLLQRLALITYQHIEEEVRVVLNGKTEVEKFRSNLKVIQAVLEEAEKRQVTEVDVREWLDKLKDVSYDMDDVLDEWNTEILKQQVQKQDKQGENYHDAKTKVCFSIPSSLCFDKVNRIILRCNISQEIKELNYSLTLIADARQKYHFQYTKGGIEQPEQQKTSSFVDASKIVGREKEKDTLVSKLLGESSQEGRGLLVISIVGMGGMGKTTLAQLAYNDENVKAHFEKRVWVCVSDLFDEIKIAKAFINSNDIPYSDELEDFLQCMSKSIKGKRFLLVLDDVCSRDHKKWEQLNLPLMQNGSKGSRIVVTTRKQEVAMMMGPTAHNIHLEKLSEQDCLSLFNHAALYEREQDVSIVFGAVGKAIAKKCKGLPLAAKTLGSLMRYKKTRKEWQDILDSKIWDLLEVQEQVFRPLLLSYYDLDPAIKRCLLYCAIFPKDYEFDVNNLIDLWMSQDYLNSKENKEKEIIGQQFFDNLAMRSFFQDLVEDHDGKIRWCKMHDIVHDFVQFLSQSECFIIEVESASDIRQLSSTNSRIELLW